MKLIEYYFSIIYDIESFMKVEEICQNCYSLLLEYQVWLIEHVVGSSNMNEVEIDPLASFDQFVTSNSLDVTSKLEIDFYLE